MTPSPRVNYDAIAHLYDAQPYRAKTVDPELVTFIGQRESSDGLSILDVGCGTGNQLVANLTIAPHAHLVGLDRSLGMLRQALPKAPHIAWVQGDAAMLPFQTETFDFVSSQYALHHMHDKAGMLQAVFRALRFRGRFVLRNLCPQESPDWLYYEYFPAAHAIDLQDFWSPGAVAAVMKATGFAVVEVELQHLRYEQDLRVLLDTARRRDICSQLMAIPDAAYQAGLQRLEKELARESAPLTRTDHLCIVTIRGDKMTDIAPQG